MYICIIIIYLRTNFININMTIINIIINKEFVLYCLPLDGILTVIIRIIRLYICNELMKLKTYIVQFKLSVRLLMI